MSVRSYFRWTIFLFSLLPFRGAIARAQSDFYSPASADLTHYADGDLIRSEVMAGAPDGANAYRVLYRSEGLSGEPIAVSGVVIVPVAPAPAGSRLVVAWAHPTTGIVSKCAPSLARVFFASVQGLHSILQHGFVVVATDYPGLGTPGVHPYLVGISEARAVLDSVRVAHRMPAAAAGTRFAVWGHSQGGHAALFTGIISHSYAPELQLAGVAAASPPTDLGVLLRDDLATSGGKNITAMTLWSWSRVYGASMGEVVYPDAIPGIDRLANLCIERFFDIATRRQPSKALARAFLKVDDVAAVEPWKTLLAKNSTTALPPEIPIFLAQGTRDPLVLPQITMNYVQGLCEAGDVVKLDLLHGVGHAFAGRDSAQTAVDWIADRFANQPAESDCSALPQLRLQLSLESGRTVDLR